MAIEYTDPLQSFRFRFFIQLGSGKPVSAAFSSFSGIRMKVETISHRDGDDMRGVQPGVPVLTRFQPVTLSKGVIGDNELLEWLLAASAGYETGPTGKDLKRDIDVIAVNDMGEDAVTWTLKNAMPIGYEMSPMDGSRSEVLMESVTFYIEGMRRTVQSTSRDKE